MRVRFIVGVASGLQYGALKDPRFYKRDVLDMIHLPNIGSDDKVYVWYEDDDHEGPLTWCYARVWRPDCIEVHLRSQIFMRERPDINQDHGFSDRHELRWGCGLGDQAEFERNLIKHGWKASE